MVNLTAYDPDHLLTMARYYFSLRIFDTCEFYCEAILNDYKNNIDTIYLLSQAYFAQGFIVKAYNFLKKDEIIRAESMEIKYFLAELCLKLNYLDEGIEVLLGKNNDCKEVLKSSNFTLPNGAYGYFLLGKILESKLKFVEACQAFSKAIKLDPFLIKAYEKLFMYQPDEININELMKHKSNLISTLKDKLTSIQDNPVSSKKSIPSQINDIQEAKLSKNAPFLILTPKSNFNNDSFSVLKTPIQQNKMNFPNPNENINNIKINADFSSNYDFTVKNFNMFSHSINEQASSNELTLRNVIVDTNNETNRNFNESIEAIVNMFEIYLYLNKAFYLHNFKEYSNYFDKLSKGHQASYKNVIRMAVILFDNHKFSTALSFFNKAIKLDSKNLDYLDKYSCCLFNLNLKAELISLSSRAFNENPYCYETWLIAGNLCSFLKEHEKAIVLYERATKVSPENNLSYIQLGHEYYILNQSYLAHKNYSNAATLYPRCFYANFSIGRLLIAENKIKEGINFYCNAIKLNPYSYKLYLELYSALLKSNQNEVAMEYLAKAESLEDKNIHIKYYRADYYYNKKDYQNAFNALIPYLSNTNTNEYKICLLVGKIYFYLNMEREAKRYLNDADNLSLGTSQNLFVKSVIDQLFPGN